MSPIEGVTAEVGAKMDALGATVICEDGMMLRQCEHGVRHPVGHLHRGLWAEDFKHRHELKCPTPGLKTMTQCCEAECCSAWR